jgi:hypothetical protein
VTDEPRKDPIVAPRDSLGRPMRGGRLGKDPSGRRASQEAKLANMVRMRRRKFGKNHARYLATQMAKNELPECIQFCIDVRDGLVPGATVADKLRAAENVLDRGGCPRQTEQDVSVHDTPRKTIDLRGWETQLDELGAERMPDAPDPNAEKPNGHDDTDPIVH